MPNSTPPIRFMGCARQVASCGPGTAGGRMVPDGTVPGSGRIEGHTLLAPIESGVHQGKGGTRCPEIRMVGGGCICWRNFRRLPGVAWKGRWAAPGWSGGPAHYLPTPFRGSGPCWRRSFQGQAQPNRASAGNGRWPVSSGWWSGRGLRGFRTWRTTTSWRCFDPMRMERGGPRTDWQPIGF